MTTADVVVVGAGAFGAFAAHHLHRSGLSVALVDAHGPGHGRATSGGDTRVLRMGYGADDLYTRFTLASRPQWLALEERTRQRLFVPCGALWLSPPDDPHGRASLEALRRHGVPHETLSRADLDGRYPHMSFDGIDGGILEPMAGVLMARRAVQALADELSQAGVRVHRAAVAPPRRDGGRLGSVETTEGALAAGAFVFACGPWLPAVFPDLLSGVVRATRQELFVFGPPAGDARYAPPSQPVWIDMGELFYGIPDIEGRGLKVAFHLDGPPFDPETGDRSVGQGAVDAIRPTLARRFPGMSGAPLLEARVCQYESTPSGDLLVDRHPELKDVWIAGGGSGHGFKLAPEVGRLVADLVTGRAVPEAPVHLARHTVNEPRRVY